MYHFFLLFVLFVFLSLLSFSWLPMGYLNIFFRILFLFIYNVFSISFLYSVFCFVLVVAAGITYII